MSSEARRRARELARKYLAAGRPLGWFEEMYAGSQGDASALPWVQLGPKPFLVDWAQRRRTGARGQRALVVGCGLGDDAAYLANLGFRVIGFDISPTAVRWSEERFPNPALEFRQADLLKPPREWTGSFHLVVDAYTLQALPQEMHRDAITQLANFLLPGGDLLVATYGRQPRHPPAVPPWPLTRDELDHFQVAGLSAIGFADWPFDEVQDPPMRRFELHYRRPPVPRRRF